MERSFFFSTPFSYSNIDLEDGLKYLGFVLKLNDYLKKDRKWLIVKVEKWINIWCHRWLSRGGRLVLLKFVLGNSSLLDVIALDPQRNFRSDKVIKF
jgi:hypothetical protein